MAGNAPRACVLSLPRSDVGVDALPAGLAVAAEREHIDLAANPGVEILVLGAPGIRGELVEVGLGPVTRNVSALGFFHQRREALVGARVGPVVELVELERADDRRDVRTRRRHPALTGTIHAARHA